MTTSAYGYTEAVNTTREKSFESFCKHSSAYGLMLTPIGNFKFSISGQGTCINLFGLE